MGAYRDYPNQIQDYYPNSNQDYKLKIKNFNSFLARKLIDEDDEDEAVEKILEEKL